ncbi:MAG TPA: hypothetical protein VNZ44_05925 [Pyrinomonadaceae bacterium]|nr:hypothetical protein [Pyrinomonadaceae bacterium]
MAYDAAEPDRTSAPRECGACGARARRAEARFCATCGRALGGGYFPSESLRASYRFERPRVTYRTDASRKSEASRRAESLRGSGAWRVPRRVALRRRVGWALTEGGDMIRGGESEAASTAFAFVTYALVPYLGILFCPGALVFGGLGLVRAWRAPRPGHARAAVLSLALALLVLGAQLFLWWILYKVPEWSRGNF